MVLSCRSLRREATIGLSLQLETKPAVFHLRMAGPLQIAQKSGLTRLLGAVLALDCRRP
jgi:hypothetical protein